MRLLPRSRPRLRRPDRSFLNSSRPQKPKQPNRNAQLASRNRNARNEKRLPSRWSRQPSSGPQLPLIAKSHPLRRRQKNLRQQLPRLLRHRGPRSPGRPDREPVPLRLRVPITPDRAPSIRGATFARELRAPAHGLRVDLRGRARARDLRDPERRGRVRTRPPGRVIPGERVPWDVPTALPDVSRPVAHVPAQDASVAWCLRLPPG